MASYDDYLQFLKVVDDRTLEELHRKENELVAQIAALKKSHQDEIMQMESTFKAKTAELKSQCTKQIDDNNGKCKDEIDSNKRQTEALVRSIKNEMEKRVDEDRNALQAVKDEAAAEIKAYKTSIAELKAKHQSVSKEFKALKTQNSKLIQEKTDLEKELGDVKECRDRYKKVLIWVSSSFAAIVMLFVAICCFYDEWYIGIIVVIGVIILVYFLAKEMNWPQSIRALFKNRTKFVSNKSE